MRASSLWGAVLGVEKTVVEEVEFDQNQDQDQGARAWSRCVRSPDSGVGAGAVGVRAEGTTRAAVGGAGGGRWTWFDAEMLHQLMAAPGERGLPLTGECGFLPEMINAVLERGMDAELTGHLGYEKGDRGRVRDR